MSQQTRATAGQGNSRRFWLLLALGLLACLTIYLAALEFRGSRGLTSRDAHQYWNIGRNIEQGNGFSFDGETPTRMRQPVYPLVIAGLMRIFGDAVWPVQLLQLLLAMLTVVATAAIARELFGERIAGWAALGAGLYYPFAVIATEIRTESVFIFLLALSVLTGLRALRIRSTGWALASGVFMGLAVLTRAPGLAFVLFIPLAGWAVLRGQDRPWREPLVMAGAALVLLMPWGIRNYMQLGEFEVLSNAGPVSIYVGTHPLAVSAWGDYFRTVERTEEYQRLLGEGPYLGAGPRRRFAAAVQERLRTDPWGVAWRGVVKIGLTWTYAPGSRPILRRDPLLFRLLQLPQAALLILTIYGAWRGERRARYFAVAVFLGTSASMFLGAPTARYTLPFMSLGVALAAHGLVALVRPGAGKDGEPSEQSRGPAAQQGPDEETTRPRPDRRRLALFLLVYFALLFHISGYIGNTMATATMSASMAIVDRGSPVIDGYMKTGHEVAYYDGHFYSGMPPGQSFLAVPLYAVTKPGLSAITSAVTPHVADLPMAEDYDLNRKLGVRRLLLLVLFTVLLAMPAAAATCVMVADLSGEYLPAAGRSGLLLLPFATLWWAFGTEYGPRIMCGFLLLLPIWWVLLRDRDASARMRWLMAGVLGAGLALAPLIRYELIIPAVAVGIWLLVKLDWRRVMLLVAVALIVGGLGAAYHKLCYGGYTTTAYNRKLWTPERLRADGFRPVGKRIEVHGREYVVYDNTRMLQVRPSTIAAALWGKGRALLRYSPFLVLALVGLGLMMARRNRQVWPLAGIFLVGMVVVGLLHHPGTRGAPGPRYMLWSLPAMVVLTLAVWPKLPAVLRGALFAVSFAPSYLAAMLTSHIDHAWSFGQVLEFGLTNYTLSRLQEAGILQSPLISTAICLTFWLVVGYIFLRPRSRWSVFAARPQDEESVETSGEGVA